MPRLGMWGCVWVLVYLVGATIYVYLTNPTGSKATGIYLVGMVVAAVIASIVTTAFRAHDTELALAKKRAKAVAAIEAEAAQLAQSTRAAYDAALKVPGALRSLLHDADTALEQAAQEYGENAFAPFWDRIERAADRLGRFQGLIRHLEQLSEQYRRALSDRKHTFPPFPVGLRELPNPAKSLRQFQRMVRMGQTNYHFASIWEHRRTRQVLIAGFRTLGEAVNNVGYSLSESVSAMGGELKASLRSLVVDSQEQRSAIDAHARREEKLLREIRDALQKRS
ncbi:MAG TPA: hypothetical protein VNJ70_14160 [Thermoanaerobaculia bacterium]|nr:hypothetical protein [Thermoanaerobaculia bacterium]